MGNRKSAYIDAEEYDISELESKHGIRTRKRERNSGEEQNARQMEQRLGVSPTENGQKKKVPRERAEPQGEEKTSQQAGKNKVKSRRQSDNLKKKKAGRSVALKEAAKREMKLQAARQVLDERKEPEENGMGTGIGQVLRSEFMSAAGKIGIKLLSKGLIFLGSFLVTLLLGCLSLLISLIPFIVVTAGLVCVLAAAALITGIFVTPDITTLDSFAVNRITAHQEALLEEVDSYDGKWHWFHCVEEVEVRYDGISDIASNSDDILLAYMTEAADLDKVMEDDGTAPLLNVNTFSEKWAMSDVLDGMLYISDVEYIKRTRVVEAEAIPVEREKLLTIGSFPLLATTVAPGGSSVPGTLATPAPEPTPEEEEKVEYETYYKVIVTITGIGAEEWVENNGNKEEDSIYTFLEEMFRSFGYHSMGGDEVCQKYLNADME